MLAGAPTVDNRVLRDARGHQPTRRVIPKRRGLSHTPISQRVDQDAATDPATIVLSAALDTADLRAPAYRAVLGSAFARARVDLVANSITITAQLER